MNPANQRGLYVHIPFCLKKCHYCDFVITTKRSEDSRERFFRALEKEFARARKFHGNLSFDTFYLGGGTPSALNAGEMERLTGMARSHFDFKPGFEFTCEINPGDVDRKKLESYRALGINRVSLGAQAFQDGLLENMGRPHDSAGTIETWKLLRELGFNNISFDLINGLPGQSLADFGESLRKVIEMEAAQLSLYDLDVHEKTVYGLRRREGRLPVPDENTRAEMFALAGDLMGAAGYLNYEISTFAKPGFESRHNLGYWHNQEYLGLGPGAFSYMKGTRSQFAPDMNRWLEKCEAGDWTPDTADEITEDKRELETLLTGLRLGEGVSLDQFKIIRAGLEEKLTQIGPHGLIEHEGSVIRLSRRGRFLAENTFSLVVNGS